MTILVYVAGPYTLGLRRKNVERAEETSIRLIRDGFDVFTPHKNTNGYEKYEDISYEHWLRMCINILSRCDMLYVMKGSGTSRGVAEEIVFARKNDIPIIYEAPHELTATGGLKKC